MEGSEGAGAAAGGGVSEFAPESIPVESEAPSEAPPEPERAPEPLPPGRAEDAFKADYERAARELGVAPREEPAPQEEEQSAAEPTVSAEELERQLEARNQEWSDACNQMSEVMGSGSRPPTPTSRGWSLRRFAGISLNEAVSGAIPDRPSKPRVGGSNPPRRTSQVFRRSLRWFFRAEIAASGKGNGKR